jgi:hypothetical protein
VSHSIGSNQNETGLSVAGESPLAPFDPMLIAKQLSKFNQVMFLHTSLEEFRQWSTRPTPKDSQPPADATSIVTNKETENESPAKVEERPETVEHNSCKHVQAMIDWYVSFSSLILFVSLLYVLLFSIRLF